VEGKGKEKLQEFMTRGSMSLSKSLLITAVGNTRGGFGLTRDAGGHFRVNFLMIG
jgi:hypothetical protein